MRDPRNPGQYLQLLAALRAAFQAMLKDPDFLAATKKRNQAMEAITRETMALPKDMVAALRKVLQH